MDLQTDKTLITRAENTLWNLLNLFLLATDLTMFRAELRESTLATLVTTTLDS